MARMVTGEQLRADIDAGRTGDKVAHPDPAAAPLVTDAEAGGDSTPFPSERRPTAHERKRHWGGLTFYIIATGTIAAFVIALAWAMSQGARAEAASWHPPAAWQNPLSGRR